jgi:hypothetical protein
MREATNKQEPSSTEGGQVKIGDKVWVRARVEDARGERVQFLFGSNWTLWLPASECRPDEPPVIEACTKTANDQLLQSLKDYPFGEPSNYPEFPDSSSEPMREAFEADMVKRYRYERASFARNEDRYFDSSMEIAWQAFQAGEKCQSHQADKPEPVKHFVIVNDQDGNQTLYIDGVLHDGDNTVYGCDIDQAAKGCAIRIESRDVGWDEDDWPRRLDDFGAQAKHAEPSPLAPSPCMDGANVDQFIEGVMEARERASDPVNPSHYKQGGIECIEAIKAATGEGFPDYLRGNVMKYLWRYKEKGGVEDLRKSAWYLDRLFKEVGE